MISKKENHGECTFVVVSDIGVSHRINGVPNQDAADYVSINEDFALAVSDGVGSCKKAELGSAAAVEAVKRVFLSQQGKSLPSALTEITGQIIDEWKLLLADTNPDDCCATLKAAMKFGDKLLLLSVGDGLLAVSSSGMKCCAPTDNTLFTNQTRCLDSSIKKDDFWTAVFKLDIYVPYVVFACSDGVSNGIQEGREMDLIKEIETQITASELQSELETLLVDISDYSSDDRTVGVVKYERTNAKSDR